MIRSILFFSIFGFWTLGWLAIFIKPFVFNRPQIVGPFMSEAEAGFHVAICAIMWGVLAIPSFLMAIFCLPKGD